MEPNIAVVPDDPVSGSLQELLWRIACLSFGRCIHPM